MITSAQNYALLVEAGMLRKPDILKGRTNPAMATIASHLGFKENEAVSHEVRAQYDDVRDIVMSDRFIDLGNKLRKRTDERYGSFAVASY